MWISRESFDRQITLSLSLSVSLYISLSLSMQCNVHWYSQQLHIDSTDTYCAEHILYLSFIRVCYGSLHRRSSNEMKRNELFVRSSILCWFGRCCVGKQKQNKKIPYIHSERCVLANKHTALTKSPKKHSVSLRITLFFVHLMNKN